jgi:hypothetical protein
MTRAERTFGAQVDVHRAEDDRRARLITERAFSAALFFFSRASSSVGRATPF